MSKSELIAVPILRDCKLNQIHPRSPRHQSPRHHRHQENSNYYNHLQAQMHCLISDQRLDSWSPRPIGADCEVGAVRTFLIISQI